MGSILEELHEKHKARQERIKRAAIKITPVEIVVVAPPPPPEPAPEPEPEAIEPLGAINQQIGKSCFDLVTNEICEYYGVRRQDILSHRRMGNLSQRRQMLAYMMYRLTTYTNGQIGAKLNLDPTTVGYAVKKIEGQIEKYLTDIEELEARISLLLAHKKAFKGT